MRNTKIMTQLTSKVWPYFVNWFCIQSCLFQSSPSSTQRLKWRKKSSDGHGKVVDEPQVSTEAKACLWWKGWAGQWARCCEKCVCSVTQLCTTLRPHGLEPARLLCHRIIQARILRLVALYYSRGSSQPRDQTRISCISPIGRWIL